MLEERGVDAAFDIETLEDDVKVEEIESESSATIEPEPSLKSSKNKSILMAPGP